MAKVHLGRCSLTNCINGPLFLIPFTQLVNPPFPKSFEASTFTAHSYLSLVSGVMLSTVKGKGKRLLSPSPANTLPNKAVSRTRARTSAHADSSTSPVIANAPQSTTSIEVKQERLDWNDHIGESKPNFDDEQPSRKEFRELVERVKRLEGEFSGFLSGTLSTADRMLRSHLNSIISDCSDGIARRGSA